MGTRRRVGVLALQGGFGAHARALRALGHAVSEVRTPGELAGLEGLVLPGGESTVQTRLVERAGLAAPLRAFHAAGGLILATCAGLILAAREVVSPAQPSLGLLDVTVERNAYGAQAESFEAVADAGALPLVFIRAPRLRRLGPGVVVLARFRGEPVLVREGNVVGAAFHPELTGDYSVAAALFGDAQPGATSQTLA